MPNRRKKPNYNPDTIMKELLDSVVLAYSDNLGLAEHSSLRKQVIIGIYRCLSAFGTIISNQEEVITIDTNNHSFSKSELWQERIQSFQESGMSRKDWCL